MNQNNSVKINLPPKFQRPFSSYYHKLNWNSFKHYDLVKFFTLGGGNCLLHSILNSCFLPYRTGILDGKNTDRTIIVKNLRREIGESLTKKDNNDKILWEKLYDGHMKEFSEEGVEEYSLNSMKSMFDSNQPLGDGALHLISELLNINIFIMDGVKKDLYVTNEYKYSIVNSRLKNIMIYYHNGHYELIGIERSKNEFITLFNNNCDIIQILLNKVNDMFQKK